MESCLEQCRLWQLGTLEKLDCFSAADKSISILIRHTKPVIEQVDVCHLNLNVLMPSAFNSGAERDVMWCFPAAAATLCLV